MAAPKAPARPKALPTFEVSKEGLAAQLARRPKAFIVAELAQNAWDEDSKNVHITLTPEDDGFYKLTVEDDNPEGFKDLSHAYTLFADSEKKGDPEKRGRFNLGEKLVIALCKQVKITTTKGSVLFTDEGRFHGNKARTIGSLFEAIIPMTDGEADEVREFAQTLIVPDGVTTTYNLTDLPSREPVAEFKETLRTEIADPDGRLKPTTRKTVVQVFDPLPGETAAIYELGIPVVETGDRFHVNVMQKVPLNTDRDNVPPAFLRDIRTAVLNHTIAQLSEKDAQATWVTNALEDENIAPEVVKAAFRKRFGEKTVVHDPNDLEANKRAAAAGYTVVPGGALSKEAWKQVKANDVVKPAGQVTPSPDPSGGEGTLKMVDPDHYTEAVAAFVAFAEELSQSLIGHVVTIQIANDAKFPYNATYGGRTMTFNLGRLGYKWFDQIGAKQIGLILHELGHEYESDHLSEGFFRALIDLGARCTLLALSEPEFFRAHKVAA